MKLAEGTVEALDDAVDRACKFKELVLVDGVPPQVPWRLPIPPHCLPKYFLHGAPYVAYPDGTVALLSRDEDAVAEFRMLYELQR